MTNLQRRIIELKFWLVINYLGKRTKKVLDFNVLKYLNLFGDFNVEYYEMLKDFNVPRKTDVYYLALYEGWSFTFLKKIYPEAQFYSFIDIKDKYTKDKALPFYFKDLALGSSVNYSKFLELFNNLNNITNANFKTLTKLSDKEIEVLEKNNENMSIINNVVNSWDGKHKRVEIKIKTNTYAKLEKIKKSTGKPITKILIDTLESTIKETEEN